MVPLLKRELLVFKKHALSIILFWILMPILIHIFLAIPLSRLITMDIRYLNWSSAGVWIATAGMAAFLLTATYLRRIHFESQQIDAILQSPITNFELISVLMLRGVIFGFCQFVFAICITSTLNHEYFSIEQILLITLQMLTIIFFFSTLGTFIGLVISNGMVFIQTSFFLFLLLGVAMGTFIPMKYYPVGFTYVMEKIPLTTVFRNTQAVILNDPIHWLSFFLTIGMTGIIIIIILIISNKVFRKI